MQDAGAVRGLLLSFATRHTPCDPLTAQRVVQDMKRSAHHLTQAVLAGVLLGSTLAACSSGSTEPGASADVRTQAVTAEVDAGELVIRNNADFTVRVGVLEAEYARTALALWCMGGDQCGTAIEPGATLRVPLSEISGYGPASEELLVHWWNPQADGEQVSKFTVRT